MPVTHNKHKTKHKRSIDLCPNCQWAIPIPRKFQDRNRNEYDEPSNVVCLANGCNRNTETQTCISCSEYKQKYFKLVVRKSQGGSICKR